MAHGHVQERPDIVNSLTNNQLIGRYRLDREGILFVNDILMDSIQPQTNRNRNLSSLQKVLITLRYLASGQFQVNNSDLHGISQPTASRVITEVISAMSDPEFVSRFIQLPTTRDAMLRNKEEFYEIAHFPNVFGLIDCTHIQIKRPVIDEPAYVNKMGYHSINTQIVLDSQDMIIDMVARWPGATHDSRILRESGLFQLLEACGLGPGDNYMLGDSGYPCKRWLLTPFRNVNAGPQLVYNRSHKKTRSKVERGIGQLKARWGILHGEIRLSPVKACKVILACGALHNICKVRNIPLPDIAEVEENQLQHEHQGQVQDGLRYREYIANTYFVEEILNLHRSLHTPSTVVAECESGASPSVSSTLPAPDHNCSNTICKTLISIHSFINDEDCLTSTVSLYNMQLAV